MSVTKTYLAGAIVLSVLLMSGCGGEPVLSCDEAQRYQLAVPGKRVVAPEGLTQLDPLKELPAPEPSPQPPRPAGSRCLDMPPGSIGGSSAAKDEEQAEESGS